MKKVAQDKDIHEKLIENPRREVFAINEDK
jgi:hypothetical protein